MARIRLGLMRIQRASEVSSPSHTVSPRASAWPIHVIAGPSVVEAPLLVWRLRRCPIRLQSSAQECWPWDWLRIGRRPPINDSLNPGFILSSWLGREPQTRTSRPPGRNTGSLSTKPIFKRAREPAFSLFWRLRQPLRYLPRFSPAPGTSVPGPGWHSARSQHPAH